MTRPQELEGKIAIYKKLITELSKAHRLTQISRLDENIKDSLAVLDLLDLSWVSRAGDLGSGVGFPGFFLGLALGCEFHLFEPRAKRAALLTLAKVKCEAENIQIHRCRIEDYEGENFQLISSRAVMSAAGVITACEKSSDEGTMFILWKGSRVGEELAQLERLGKKARVMDLGRRKFLCVGGCVGS